MPDDGREGKDKHVLKTDSMWGVGATECGGGHKRGDQGHRKADYSCPTLKRSPSCQESCKPGSKALDNGQSSTWPMGPLR